MSGGAYGYAYIKLSEFIDEMRMNGDCSCASPEKRRAFREHLELIQDTMRAIEWNDSGDGNDQEEAMIDRVLAGGSIKDAITRPIVQHTVIAVYWTESERGWGTRPDGVSLHIDDRTRVKFVKNYWDNMPDEVPDEYSRPEVPFKLVVGPETHKKLVAAGGSLRLWDKNQLNDGELP